MDFAQSGAFSAIKQLKWHPETGASFRHRIVHRKLDVWGGQKPKIEIRATHKKKHQITNAQKSVHDHSTRQKVDGFLPDDRKIKARALLLFPSRLPYVIV